jgi:hypothetical protein
MEEAPEEARTGRRVPRFRALRAAVKVADNGGIEVAHDEPDSTLGWCDDQTEFEFALDLILDGLDRTRQEASPGPITHRE